MNKLLKTTMNRCCLYVIVPAFAWLTSCDNSPQEPVVINPSAARNNGQVVSPAATGQRPSSFDQSPMDIVYYPVDFPKLKSQEQSAGELPKARVIYSRPQRHGRVIFGELQKYGHAWRMGANEATEIELFTDALVQGKRIAKGRYIMYCIPEENEWTIVFNSALYTWGLHFNKEKDVLRITIPIEKLPVPVEVMSISFRDSDGGAADLIVEWDTVRAMVGFRF